MPRIRLAVGRRFLARSYRARIVQPLPLQGSQLEGIDFVAAVVVVTAAPCDQTVAARIGDGAIPRSRDARAFRCKGITRVVEVVRRANGLQPGGRNFVPA